MLARGPDVLIIGGGAIGCAIASFLTSAPQKPRRVRVLERDPAYRTASSALSASSLRQQFSTPLNVKLSQFTWDYLKQLVSKGVAVDLVECGYLFLGTHAQAPVLRARAELARSCGAHIEEYDGHTLQRRYPWLNADNLAYGSRATAGEGWFDGYALLRAYRERARAQGAEFLAVHAASFTTDDVGVTGVVLEDGRIVKADCCVVACGAWSRHFIAQAGVDLPVYPRRRTVFVMSSPVWIDDLPIVVDSSGVFVRRDGQRYLTIVSPAPEHDADEPPLYPELHLFDEVIWPALARRSHAFEALRVERSWAGYYEYNVVDQNGFVGTTDVPRLYVAAGFSGHGLQHSAGIGIGMSELICEGAYRTIDLSPLSLSRLSKRQLLIEGAVY